MVCTIQSNIETNVGECVEKAIERTTDPEKKKSQEKLSERRAETEKKKRYIGDCGVNAVGIQTVSFRFTYSRRLNLKRQFKYCIYRNLFKILCGLCGSCRVWPCT